MKLVSFLIELPEPVGIPHGSILSFQSSDHYPELDGMEFRMTSSSPPIIIPPGEGNAVVAFFFSQVAGSQLSPPALWEATDVVMRDVLGAQESQPRDPAPQLFEYRTVVIASSPMRWREAPDKDELTTAFDRCEEYLVKLINAYRIVAPQPIAPVRRETLPAIVPFLVHSLPPRKDDEPFKGMFNLHLNVPHSPEMLQGEALQKLRLMVDHVLIENPFSTYSLRSKEAVAALNERGDTAECVIRAQMASEVLLDSLLMSMMWEEGADPVECAQVFGDEGFGKRVRTHFGRRLGGDWNTRADGVMGRWQRSAVGLRGRVVHGNYTPTRQEARTALDAVAAVDKFIRERLVANRHKYKRTTLMLLARPGLERLGGWSGDIVKFVEEQANQEPDWRASLRAWREQLNAAR